MKRFGRLIIFILTIPLIFGCSGSGGDVSQPGVSDEHQTGMQAGFASHQNWGVWQFTADAEEGTLDAVQIRTGGMHLNALHFLEPPPLVYLSIESLEFIGDIIDCVIGLRHPFLGLTEFTGFDVCGVLITNGSISGFENADLIMAGEGDTHLTNPDGFTRWWNPSEFPHDGGMFGYKDGMLGTPDSAADYNSTLNAYKFFCGDLADPDDEVGELDPSNRCVFHAGSKNTRRYVIKLGAGGLTFNYAVDACWEFPSGGAPWTVPDDFGPGANRPEAWHVSVTELENTLWNDGVDSGGELNLLADAWDHYSPELNAVKIESPGNFDSVSSSSPTETGAGYARYHLHVSNATPAEDSIDLLIGVECEATGYQGLLPGEKVTAYFVHASDVADTSPSTSTFHIIAPNGGEKLQQDCPYAIEWESSGDPIADVKLEYSTDGFLMDFHTIVASTPNDGQFTWDVPAIESDTVRVRVSDVLNPAVKDISDGDFSIFAVGEPIWPKYKYDPSNHGRSPYEGPSTNNLLWTFNCAANTTPGPSIGGDGTIYVGTNDGHLHAVYPDGTERYSLDLGNYVLGTPAIAPDGTVYAGTWGPGRLYAIRCDGDIEWEFDTAGDINKCHPAIADDGTIYIGTNGGRFWAVNPDGSEKWHYDSNGGFTPSPAIGPDGEVYFTMSGGHAYGINDLGQDSFEIFWNHNFAGEHIGNSPSVDDDGVVYVCGLYLNTVWACDPDTDTILWTFDAPDGFDEASPTIDEDGTLYIGCNDHNMYAVNPGGSVKWATPVGERVPSSVILDPAGHIYFGTRGGGGANGTFYCLDSSDGSVIWQYSIGEHIRCTAAIAPDGTLYVGGHDAVLRAIKDP